MGCNDADDHSATPFGFPFEAFVRIFDHCNRYQHNVEGPLIVCFRAAKDRAQRRDGSMAGSLSEACVCVISSLVVSINDGGRGISGGAGSGLLAMGVFPGFVPPYLFGSVPGSWYCPRCVAITVPMVSVFITLLLPHGWHCRGRDAGSQATSRHCRRRPRPTTRRHPRRQERTYTVTRAYGFA